MASHSLPLLLLALAAPAGAVPTGDPDVLFDSGTDALAWPSSAVDFGHAVLADGDGDLHPDLLQIHGTTATVARGVGYYRHFVDLALDCTAGSYSGSANGFVLADSQGYSFFPEPRAVARVQYTDALFADAVQILHAANTLVSRKANGAVVARTDPFGGSGSSVTLLSSGATQIALLDWSGTAQPELLVLGNAGLYVFDLGGTLLSSMPVPNSGGILIPMRQTGYANQRLAAILNMPAGDQVLYAGDAASGPEAGIIVGSGEIHSGAAGDLVGGTSADLALLDRDGLALHVYENGEGAWSTTFSAAAKTTRPLLAVSHTPDSAAGAQVVIGDIDGDGDLEAGAGIEFAYDGVDERWIAFALNDTIDAQEQRLELVVDPNPPQGGEACEFRWDYPAPSLGYGENDPAPAGLLGQLTVYLDLPASAGNWDAIQWTVYKDHYDPDTATFSGFSFSPEVQDTASMGDTLEMELLSSYLVIVPPGSTGSDPGTVGFVADLVAIEIRPVDLDASQEIEAAGPSTLFTFTIDESLHDSLYGPGQPGTFDDGCIDLAVELPGAENNHNDPPPREERVEGGGVGPQPKIPPLEP